MNKSARMMWIFCGAFMQLALISVLACLQSVLTFLLLGVLTGYVAFCWEKP
jgi:hypothetical protein